MVSFRLYTGSPNISTPKPGLYTGFSSFWSEIDTTAETGDVGSVGAALAAETNEADGDDGEVLIEEDGAGVSALEVVGD